MHIDNKANAGRLVAFFTLNLLYPVAGFAGGGGLPPLVQDIGYSLFLAGALAVLFHRFKIPSIAAFLVAGVLAGPVGIHLVTDPANIETIAELGLVLLLFVIGLELDLRKILSTGRIIVLGGLLQYPLTVLFGFAAAKLLFVLGVASLGSGYAPLYVGIVVAASSTLLVVKLFQESFQLDTTSGRVSLGLLIFQDIWAIVIIAVQPNFADPRLVPILLSFAGIGLLATLTFLMARFLLSIVFRWIARVPELLLVAATAWCFGIVFLGGNLDQVTERLFGLNLHLTVGSGMSALLAGASIASLPASADLIGEVGGVKDFFVTLFFVGLGMSIPVPDSSFVLVLALLLAVLALVARSLVFFPLLYGIGLDRRNAMGVSTRLAQVSEFSLVIAYAGVGLGHIDTGLNSAIVFSFVVTALLTPLLFHQTDRIYDLLIPVLERLGLKAPKAVKADEGDHDYSLALLGFHRLASSLLHELQRVQPELLERLLVVDFNLHIHDAIAGRGPAAHYADLANPEALRHAGVAKAKVVLITVQDDVLKGTSNRRMVHAVRQMNPEALIIANAIELKESRHLYEAGADYVYLSRVDAARGLLPVIEMALEGRLHQYRADQEDRDGPWEERDEIVP